MIHSFTLYRSDSLGRASNCMYPHAVQVTDTASLAAAVSFDYVAVEYKNGYRNNANFLRTDCLALDCDKDHSEDPNQVLVRKCVGRYQRVRRPKVRTSRLV